MSISRFNFFTVENVLSKVNRERCCRDLLQKGWNYTPASELPSAAVLVPLCVDRGQLSLLYTKRSINLNTHKGQVAFPGGKKDPEDVTLTDTALRETEEELGIPRSSVDVWTEMKPFPGRDFKILITPVVGFINNYNSTSVKMHEPEVEDFFTVSLENLTDPQNITTETFKNGWTFPIFNAGKFKIWGITAVITQAFLSSLLPVEAYDPSTHSVKFKASL